MPQKNDFSKKLISWYRENKRDLPWRNTNDPYKIWISEIMLQQTTVSAVIPYYERWIKSFPDVHLLARVSLQKILKQWQGLGYYRRARNIQKAAKIIVSDYDGSVPSDSESLRKLPGFGPYTTGAVLSIAFNRRYPIVDANVRRVIMRQLALEGHADTSKDKEIINFLDDVMPQKNMSCFNQGLMELGALICRTDSPRCIACPVKNTCAAYKKGVQEIIPESKKRIIKKIDAVIAVIENKGLFFIQKRTDKGLLADLWEFPGGKIEDGETPRKTLIRELKEEVGAEVISVKQMMKLKHFYTQFEVHLHVYVCKVNLPLKKDASHRWVGLKKISSYPMPSGSSKIVDFILKREKA